METEQSENQTEQIEPNYDLDKAEILVGLTLIAGASVLDCYQDYMLAIAAVYFFDGFHVNSLIKNLTASLKNSSSQPRE